MTSVCQRSGDHMVETQIVVSVVTPTPVNFGHFEAAFGYPREHQMTREEVLPRGPQYLLHFLHETVSSAILAFVMDSAFSDVKYPGRGDSQCVERRLQTFGANVL